MEILEKVIIWYVIHETGDKHSSLVWFLSEEKALQYKSDEPDYVLTSPNFIETFIGSDIYNEAMKNKIAEDAYYVVCETKEEYKNSYLFGFLYNTDTKTLLMNNFGVEFSLEEKNNINNLLKEKIPEISEVVFKI